MSPAEIARGAESGDTNCRATLDRYIDRLARGLAAVINLVDPDAIVLGGGLSAIGALYDEVPRRWGDYVFSDRVDDPPARTRGTAMRAACAARPGCGRRSPRNDDAVPRLQRLYARPPPDGRCAHCASPRLVSHERLADLAIAHVDCDAFYATVEKRERPELADRPVIVGGGKRGVVLACCYVARLYGVRSAMPMFKALAACPDAEVIRPNMAKYREVGRAVRAEMRELTPLVEPVSIDEAFLDLSGTEALHGAAPAQLLADPRPPGRGDARHHLVDRAQRQQISRQDRLRPRQAARLCRPRPRRCAGFFRRQAGVAAVGRRARRCSAGSPPTGSS